VVLSPAANPRSAWLKARDPWGGWEWYCRKVLLSRRTVLVEQSRWLYQQPRIKRLCDPHNCWRTCAYVGRSDRSHLKSRT